MSETKFTPGPWRANFEDYTKPYVEILNEDNLVIAQIPDGEIIRGDKTILGLENIEANINLIADAWQLPDLRKENAELKAINKDMYEALDYLRIAAQKVCDDFCCGAGCSQDVRDCKLEGELIRAEIALRKARGERE